MSENASTSPVVLYAYALSPYALKVRSYLLYKKIPFETVYVDPTRVRQELPLGRMVPVLGYNGSFRNESSSIGEWLDELFPETEKLIYPDAEEALQWVDTRLIPAVFSIFLGINDSTVTKAKKRWSASGALNKTVPVGVDFKFRFLHMLYIHRAPFIARLLNEAKLSSDDSDIKKTLSIEFEELLDGAQFLGGRASPSIADLSALPQIILPILRGENGYLIESKAVTSWVKRMTRLMPNYWELLPPVLCKSGLPSH